MKRATFAVLVSALSTPAFANDPDCDEPDGWPASQAFSQLRNETGLNADLVDFSKTRVRRLASQKSGKDLYVQVHLVTLMKKTGEPVPVITVNEASHQECSMSGADVYVVSNKYEGYTDKNGKRIRLVLPPAR